MNDYLIIKMVGTDKSLFHTLSFQRQFEFSIDKDGHVKLSGKMYDFTYFTAIHPSLCNIIYRQ